MASNPYTIRGAACCVSVGGEPQHLTLTGSVLGLSDGGGSVDLGPLLDAAGKVCLFDVFDVPIPYNNIRTC